MTDSMTQTERRIYLIKYLLEEQHKPGKTELINL